jgi:hypothetical protein
VIDLRAVVKNGMPMTKTTAINPSIHALLTHIVDYAGLFPPAQLDMAATVGNYSDYLGLPDSWMLGRLVVPAAKLDEFEREATARLPKADDAEPWMITAIVAPAAQRDAMDRDLDRVAAFNELHADAAAGLALIDVIELKADSVGTIEAALDRIPDDLFPFFEIPSDRDPRGLIASLVGSDAGAKIRTGGVTADAYPPARDVARFIAACAGADVAFKATAGLHHPLTHRSAKLDAQEFGFLNVFIAACMAKADRLDAGAIEAALVDGAPGAFEFGDDALAWRGRTIDAAALAELRQTFAISFGSCSFDEPREDLRGLGLL